MISALAVAMLGGPAPGGPVFDTTHGPVRGKVANGSKMWLGVPFAAAPLADLRFRPPQPPADWHEPKDATEYGASCLQFGSPQVGGRWAQHGGWATLNLTDSSEDCLYANVYVPETATPDEPLPIMVYLHAGEFRFGTAQDAESDHIFNKGSMILVTGNARLGAFGFMASDALRKRDTVAGSTGNYGMQDQRLLLKWTRANAKAFGGDPNRITIFGESSGGASVAFHLVTNQSQGLYNRAILESPGITQSKSWADSTQNTQFVSSALTAAGSPRCSWPKDPVWLALPGMEVRASQVPLAVFGSLETGKKACELLKKCLLTVTHTNGSTVLYGAGTAGMLSTNGIMLFNASRHNAHLPYTVQMLVVDDDDAVNCMVEASANDLVSLIMAPIHSDTFFTDAVAPTIDGVELSTPLQYAVRHDMPKGVDVLAGSNMDEGTEFMSTTPPISCGATAADFEKWASELFGPDLGPKVPALYQTLELPTPVCGSDQDARAPGSTDQPYMGAMRSCGDSAIMCRTRDLVRTANDLGSNAYWYYFVATPLKSLNMGDLPAMGAFHGAEIPFVFGDAFELSSAGERRLAASMGCYWSNFAATGNPNTGPCAAALALPEWPAIGENFTAMQLSNTSVSIRKELKAAQCNLFAQYP